MKWILGLLPFALALAIWYALSASGAVLELFLPSPAQTWDTFVALLRDGTLIESVGVSLRRLVVGWLIGVLAATLVGWALGMFDWARRAVQPLLFPLRFIEPVAWLSMVILWFGTGETSKILLLAYSSFFGSFLYILTTVSNIDETKLRASRSLGANRRQLFTSVIVPSTIPGILSGARVGMGYSFLTIVTAEMVNSTSGVGYIIAYGSVYMQADRIFVGTIVVGLMGIAVDWLFHRTTRRFGRKYFLDHI